MLYMKDNIAILFFCGASVLRINLKGDLRGFVRQDISLIQRLCQSIKNLPNGVKAEVLW